MTYSIGRSGNWIQTVKTDNRTPIQCAMNLRKAVLAAALALMVGAPTPTAAGLDVLQQTIRRAQEEKQRLAEKRRAAALARERLLQEHLLTMEAVIKLLHRLRPGPDMTPNEIGEWMVRHQALMEVILGELMREHYSLMRIECP
jgi:hypothetical protein